MKLSEHETLWLKKEGAETLKTLGIKAGDTVLDFGCGEGRYTTPLSQIVGPQGSVLAVERNEEPLMDLQKRVAQFSNPQTVTHINIENLDQTNTIAKGSVDVILAFDVLQYIEDRESLFSYFCSVIKSGGIICIYPAAVPHPGDVDITLIRKIMEKVGFKYVKESTFKMMHNIDMVDDIVYSFTK